MNKTTTDCKDCAYETNKGASGCKAFTKKPKPCWNHTTPHEANEREKQIKRYQVME